MSFSKLVPGDRGVELKRLLIAAIREAYAENVARHAPDDIGDNNTTFGVSVSHNLRFLAERAVEGMAGVEARRPRNSFVLDVDGRHAIFLYKAPPGVTSIHSLRFDESELKVEIATVNAAQLELNFENPTLGGVEAQDTPLPSHAVIVHFGDSETGFRHAVVGAPYRTLDGGCEWWWEEAFEDPAGRLQRDGSVDPAGDGGHGFGLRLREVEAEEHDAQDEEGTE